MMKFGTYVACLLYFLDIYSFITHFSFNCSYINLYLNVRFLKRPFLAAHGGHVRFSRANLSAIGVRGLDI
jgi:hypothetical protein